MSSVSPHSAIMQHSRPGMGGEGSIDVPKGRSSVRVGKAAAVVEVGASVTSTSTSGSTAQRERNSKGMSEEASGWKHYLPH